MRFFLVVLLGLIGCGSRQPENNDTDSKGSSGDDSATDMDCEIAVLSTVPLDGNSDVYFQQVFTVSFAGDGSSAVITVTDPADQAVSITDMVWAAGNVQVSFRPALAPNTTYHLNVALCGTTTSVVFATNELGTPIAGGNESLVGNTFVTRLSEATITDPAVLDPLLGQYLTLPLLFEVVSADATQIQLLGAPGIQLGTGAYVQDLSQPTWDFPSADFTQSPYFLVRADSITIAYEDTQIPMEDFVLEGTFTADGTSITHGRVNGLGDTRYLGELVNQPGVEGAVCQLAGAMGVTCEACADGEPYCLFLVAEGIEAALEAGLNLEVVPG